MKVFWVIFIKCYYEHFSDNNGHIANVLDNVGSVFDMREEYGKAVRFHLKGLWHRIWNGGLYTPDTITSFHNLANTWYGAGKGGASLIAESIAVKGLKRLEASVEDYPIYMGMGKALERMHLSRLALWYYICAYRLLSCKREIVSETVEIYLILATYVDGWEKSPYSKRGLLKADRLLADKEEWRTKDYELKVAISFSLERYCYYHGCYEEALKYLDAAERVINSELNADEYQEVMEAILELREEIKDCM